MPVFQPPTADHLAPVYVVEPDPVRPVHPLATRLFRHFKPRAVGLSVLKLDGAYQTIETPTQEQCEAASEVYLGGHVYEVSQTVADALTAAGYSVTADVTGSWSSLIAVRWDDLAALEWGWV